MLSTITGGELLRAMGMHRKVDDPRYDVLLDCALLCAQRTKAALSTLQVLTNGSTYTVMQIRPSKDRLPLWAVVFQATYTEPREIKWEIFSPGPWVDTLRNWCNAVRAEAP